MFNHVLMVCTGNICRSPYAEMVLTKLAPSLTVTSAGLAAMVNQGADKAAIRVGNERGLMLETHTPRQITTAIVAESDLILVMDDGHYEKLLKRYAEARGKTFKLGKWFNNKDIVDPYLRNDDFFKLVYDEIDKAIDSWLPHLNISR